MRNNKGMTLLEIMIVLAILGGLIAILAGQVTGSLKKARIKEAKIQIAEISKALDLFYTDCGFYPEALEALMEAPSSCSSWGPDPYIKKIPKDPWGSPLLYELDGNNPVIISLGEDRRDGGTVSGQDISSEDL